MTPRSSFLEPVRVDPAGVWELTGLAFLGLYASLMAVPVLSLALGIQIGGWMVFAGVGLWLAGLGISERGHGSGRLVVVIIIVGLALMIAVLVARTFYDMSYDGRTYHQQAVIALADGWNPFDGAASRESYGIWVGHYPIGFETAAAPLYRLIGSIEAAKALHILPLGASLFLTVALLIRLGLRTPMVWLCSLIATMNPVWIVQSLSFYVDGQSAALLLAAVASGLALVLLGGNPRASVALAMSLGLLIDLKFSGVFYAGLFIVSGAIAFGVMHRRADLRVFVTIQGAAVVVAVALLGFHPYATNTLDHGHPLYPLMGDDSIDVITSNTPLNLRGSSQAEQLLYGVFGRPGNPIDTEAELVVPFAAIAGPGYAYTTTDARIAGLGPWFGGVLLLAGSGALWLLRVSERKVRRAAMLAMMFLVGTVVAHPEGWWARYAPQLWLVPVVVLVWAGLVAGWSGRVVTGVLAFTLLVNTGFVTFHYLRANVDHGREVEAIFEPYPDGTVMSVYLDDAFRTATLVQFEEAGIEVEEYQSADALPCADSAELPLAAGRYCPP